MEESEFHKILSKENKNNEFGANFTFQEDIKDDDLPEIGDNTLQDLISEFESLNCKGEYKKEHQAKNYVSK